MCALFMTTVHKLNHNGHTAFVAPPFPQRSTNGWMISVAAAIERGEENRLISRWAASARVFELVSSNSGALSLPTWSHKYKHTSGHIPHYQECSVSSSTDTESPQLNCKFNGDQFGASFSQIRAAVLEIWTLWWRPCEYTANVRLPLFYKGVENIFVCDLSSELRISTSTQPICTGQKPVNSQFSAEFYDKYFKTLTPIWKIRPESLVCVDYSCCCCVLYAPCWEIADMMNLWTFEPLHAPNWPAGRPRSRPEGIIPKNLMILLFSSPSAIMLLIFYNYAFFPAIMLMHAQQIESVTTL